MRNKDVIAYLGLWEKLNNENAMLQTKISSLEEQNRHLNLTKSALNVKK